MEAHEAGHFPQQKSSAPGTASERHETHEPRGADLRAEARTFRVADAADHRRGQQKEIGGRQGPAGADDPIARDEQAPRRRREPERDARPAPAGDRGADRREERNAAGHDRRVMAVDRPQGDRRQPREAENEATGDEAEPAELRPTQPWKADERQHDRGRPGGEEHAADADDRGIKLAHGEPHERHGQAEERHRQQRAADGGPGKRRVWFHAERIAGAMTKGQRQNAWNPGGTDGEADAAPAGRRAGSGRRS